MNYIEISEIQDIMKQAYKGDEKSRGLIRKMEVPFAVSQDYSEMILVQDKHVSFTEDGKVKVLHMAPKDAKTSKQVADIYRCDKDGVSWFNIPIPFSFDVCELKYDEGIFSFVSNDFVSNDNRVISGTLHQISRAMNDVLFTINGVFEKEIENCFLNIPTTVVSPSAEKKNATEISNIEDNIIGILTFNEQFQQFETFIENKSHGFRLCINTNSSKEALKLIPMVHKVLNNFEQTDLCARSYAADELLEILNSNWLEEDEELVTRDDFISRMSVDTILFNYNKKFEIWYSDGDLFWGHNITVYFNKNHKLERVEMNG